MSKQDEAMFLGLILKLGTERADDLLRTVSEGIVAPMEEKEVPKLPYGTITSAIRAKVLSYPRGRTFYASDLFQVGKGTGGKCSGVRGAISNLMARGEIVSVSWGSYRRGE